MDPLDDSFDELLQLQNEIENEQMNQFNNSFHNENPYLDELFNPYDDQIELLYFSLLFQTISMMNE